MVLTAKKKKRAFFLDGSILPYTANYIRELLAHHSRPTNEALGCLSFITCWEATSAQRSVALKGPAGKGEEEKLVFLLLRKKDRRFGRWVSTRDERFQSRTDSQTAPTYINPVTPSDHPKSLFMPIVRKIRERRVKM